MALAMSEVILLTAPLMSPSIEFTKEENGFLLLLSEVLKSVVWPSMDVLSWTKVSVILDILRGKAITYG